MIKKSECATSLPVVQVTLKEALQAEKKLKQMVNPIHSEK